MCLFVVEAGKGNGEPYPSKTVYHILAGLLRFARSEQPNFPNFLDPKDVRFKKLQGTMDTHFRRLRQAGVGAEVKHAGVTSDQEESSFWDIGILGTSTPLSLLRSVFYYNGKMFCLRGGEEHRQLKFSQLKRVSKGYIYTENGSKNRSGGVAQMKVENKVVPSYAVDEIGERCHVHLLDLYRKRVPSEALAKDTFYLRPLEKVGDTPDSPWYTCVPIGKNTLQQMLPKMCEEAGIARRGNHSLRATGATAMFRANLPEKVLQSRTSHISLKALRMYENITDEQHSAACSTSDLVSRPNASLPDALKPTQPLARPLQLSVVQAPSPAPMVPAALFGSPQNCTINVQVFNQPYSTFRECPPLSLLMIRLSTRF